VTGGGGYVVAGDESYKGALARAQLAVVVKGQGARSSCSLGLKPEGGRLDDMRACCSNDTTLKQECKTTIAIVLC
jgi:hypothetical protein